MSSNLKFNPIFGSPMSREMTVAEFRATAPGSAWRYNPWTGKQRLEDMDDDPYGHGIIAPVNGSDLATEQMNARAAAVQIGMQTLHPNAINLMAIAMAEKLDAVIRRGLDLMLVDWSMETIAERELAVVRLPDGSSVYEVQGKQFLQVYPITLLPSPHGSEISARFDYRFLVGAQGQPEEQDEPELSMSQFASKADFDAAKAAREQA